MMGMFDFLFKPNVKKMILKDKKYDYLSYKKPGRDKLISMGKSAVEPLIQAMEEHIDQHVLLNMTLENIENAIRIRKEAALILGEIGDVRAVEPLIRVLKDNKDVREEAIHALGKIGDTRAVEPLIRALQDENSNVRGRAAEALGKIGDTRAVEPLSQTLKDYANGTRSFAQNTRAIEPLRWTLKDESWVVRCEAVEALGMIGDTRVVEPLIQALQDENSNVRSRAAKVLGNIGDEIAVEPLIQASKDENKYVRGEAGKALANIGDARAVEALVQLIKDNDEYVRKETTDVLKEIKDTRAMEPLVQAMKDADGNVRNIAAEVLEKLSWKPNDEIERAYYLIAKGSWEKLIEVGKPAIEPLIQALKDENRYVRTKAAKALGNIGDARAIEPLIQALRDVNDVHREAAEALEKIGEPAVEPLIQALIDIDDVHREAAEVLGMIGNRRAVEPLIQALKDDRVRWEAAIALGKIGDARSVEPLIQALKDVNRYYEAETVVEALGKIGDKRATESVITYLFKYTDRFHEDGGKFDSETLRNLFENYTDIIIKINGFFCRREGVYEYEYSPNFAEITKLCGIHTQISNNILHQIAEVRDIRVTLVLSHCSEGKEGILSFAEHKKIARKELERRGNPPYNPSAYLDEKAWKL